MFNVFQQHSLKLKTLRCILLQPDSTYSMFAHCAINTFVIIALKALSPLCSTPRQKTGQVYFLLRQSLVKRRSSAHTKQERPTGSRFSKSILTAQTSFFIFYIVKKCGSDRDMRRFKVSFRRLPLFITSSGSRLVQLLENAVSDIDST